MEMRPMIYRSREESKDMIKNKKYKTILYEGDYKYHHFVILSLQTHPTAYVENKYNLDYYSLDDKIMVHGGLTYGNYGSYNNWNNKDDHRHYIGWDYAHCDDWLGDYEDSFNNELDNKKWTTEEIFEEVKNVIDQLIKLESEM